MAFHVLQADIAAARSIAERALRTIDFREEEEKMNLWIAYVNLEHKYGNPLFNFYANPFYIPSFPLNTL